MWILHRTPTFQKQAFKLRKTRYSKALEEAISDLANSDNPASLGSRKRGSFSDAYSYDIGKSVRIIYRVNFNNKVIVLVAVGSHKEVYGKD